LLLLLAVPYSPLPPLQMLLGLSTGKPYGIYGSKSGTVAGFFAATSAGCSSVTYFPAMIHILLQSFERLAVDHFNK
jgi:hypothetical protein